jgi:hypothetical protein
MRINIPWGGIFLIGGLLLVYATDVPDFIGWIAVAFGVFSMVMTVIALAIMNAGVKSIEKHGVQVKDLNDKTYRTNHGRTRVRPTSKQS